MNDVHKPSERKSPASDQHWRDDEVIGRSEVTAEQEAELVAIALRAAEAMELTAKKMLDLVTLHNDMVRAGGLDDAEVRAEYQRKARAIAAEIPRGVIRQCSEQVRQLLDMSEA